MDWKQELLKRLDILADKIGTTGTYLWHVLVKEGYISGIKDVGLSILFLIIFSISTPYAVKFWKKVYKADAYKSDESDIAWGFVFSLLSLVGFVFFICFIYDGIGELFNPEYFALQKLLETLGK